MNFIRKYFEKRAFLKNSLTLLTGTIIGQAVPVLISPILSRLYTPEDFGAYALYISVCSACAIFSTGSYEYAVLFPRRDRTACHVAVLSIMISAAAGLILLAVILRFDSELCRIFHNENFSRWLYLIPISVFLTALYQILNYWFNRKKLFRQLSVNKINQSLAISGISLLLGIKKIASGGLIIGSIIGLCASAAFLSVSFVRKIRQYRICPRLLYLTAVRYADFPRYNILSNLLNNLSGALPVFLLGIFFNAGYTGFYSMAYKCVSLPMSLIGGSVGQVFLQRISECRNDRERIREITLQIYKKLLLTAAVPFIPLFGFGDWIFSFALGKFWLAAGEYAQLLSLWLVMVFVASPLSGLFYLLERQRQGLIFNIILFCSRLGALCIGGFYYKDAYAAVDLYGKIGFAAWFVFLMYLLDIAGVAWREKLMPMILYVGLPLTLAYAIRYFLNIYQL